MEDSGKMDRSSILYDVIVIGGGPGGYPAALRGATFGAKVALIEIEEELGGTCCRQGCIPTKALYSSAHLIEDIRTRADSFGIEIENYTLNFKKAVERKDKVVSELVSGIKTLMEQKNVDVYHGFGKLHSGDKESGFKVEVIPKESACIEEGECETYLLKGKRIIIATGSRPIHRSFYLDHENILDSDDILAPKFNQLPKSIIIIGGGVIGCEMANIFAQFGSEVILLEYLPTILATEESLLANYVRKNLKELGVRIYTNQNVLRLGKTKKGVVAVSTDSRKKDVSIENAKWDFFDADKCLVSIGRLKASGGINCDKFGIKTDRGAIIINHDTTETDCPGIYAIGDVTGEWMLAHYATMQGMVSIVNALDSIGGFNVKPRVVGDALVPSTTYTNPVLGKVGLDRLSAKKKYGDILIGRFMYSTSGKAKSMGREEGLMMITVDKASDKIVGAACAGAGAPELIAEVAVAIEAGMTVTDFTHIVHSHPTLSEIVLEAAEDVHGLAIHKAGKIK